MKKYDVLVSFGCSFTEGGGLNNQNYHNYLNGNPILKEPLPVLDEHIEYMNYHCYPGYLSRLLDCKVENYGISCGSNELMFKNLYNRFCNYNSDEHILVTLQSTILSRMLLNFTGDDKSININGPHGVTGTAKTYYELYFTWFFNRQKEYEKLLQNLEVYTQWLKSKNIDVVWLLYETPSSLPANDCVVNLDNKTLTEYARVNNLRLSDLPNFPYSDTHLSLYGNECVANKIYQHLEKYDY